MTRYYYVLAVLVLLLSIGREGELLRREITTYIISLQQDYKKTTPIIQSWVLVIQLHVIMPTCVDRRPPPVGLWDIKQRSWRATNSATLHISLTSFFWSLCIGHQSTYMWGFIESVHSWETLLGSYTSSKTNTLVLILLRRGWKDIIGSPCQKTAHVDIFCTAPQIGWRAVFTTN